LIIWKKRLTFKRKRDMTALQEVEKILTRLNFAEKAQLLKWVVQDLDIAAGMTGIESKPGVCGGVPCIVRTRIPVWTLVQMRFYGTSEAQILESFPSLRAEDLANAWAYYRSHSIEIDKQIQENENA
jgi:uncharacterized protein (DUF433 family)